MSDNQKRVLFILLGVAALELAITSRFTQLWQAAFGASTKQGPNTTPVSGASSGGGTSGVTSITTKGS